MITDLEIKNFRCFESVAVSGLKRVNIVTGANATGKSALLEALFLGARATGDAVYLINQTRSWLPVFSPLAVGGLLPFAGTISPGIHFDHFFRSSRHNGLMIREPNIEINYTDSDAASYSLKISYQSAGGEPALVASAAPGTASTVVPVIFERKKSSNGQDKTLSLTITTNPSGQLQHPPTSHLGPATFIFSSLLAYSEADNITWFSQLREKNESGAVVDFIRSEFSFVTDLEILSPQGINSIYAVLTDGTRRRLPLVSAGIHKIFSILLATGNTKNGIILIDEIENGIFYEKYPSVWRILYRFAQKTENQIFVSSHSDECLRALPGVIDEHPEEFSLLRAERRNSDCLIRHISGAALKAALSREGEIRGASIATETTEHR